MPMPVADFLYSPPTTRSSARASTGGYVGRETVDGVATVHLAYQHPGVRTGISWLNEQGDPLPEECTASPTRPSTPPRTVEAVFYSKWQLGAAVADAAFARRSCQPATGRIPLAVQADESAAAAAAPATP